MHERTFCWTKSKITNYLAERTRRDPKGHIQSFIMEPTWLSG